MKQLRLLVYLDVAEDVDVAALLDEVEVALKKSSKLYTYKVAEVCGSADDETPFVALPGNP